MKIDVDINEDRLVGLATDLGHAMCRVGALITTVESCTGGLLARALTETAGASEWFERGFVTYSNQAKIDQVGVRPLTLETHGAVSEEIAREMAAGGLRNSRAALSLSVTGIAGPGGAVADKPVGTVCFGWALRLPGGPTEELVRSAQWHFSGDRAAVRRQSAAFALIEAARLLELQLKDGPLVG